MVARTREYAAAQDGVAEDVRDETDPVFQINALSLLTFEALDQMLKAGEAAIENCLKVHAEADNRGVIVKESLLAKLQDCPEATAYGQYRAVGNRAFGIEYLGPHLDPTLHVIELF